MSSLECLYGEHIENCKIKNAIVDRKKEKNKFILYVYCMKEDIFIDQEKRLLNLLYKKHGLSWLRYKLPAVTEILSLKKHCNSHLFLLLIEKKTVYCFIKLYLIISPLEK